MVGVHHRPGRRGRGRGPRRGALCVGAVVAAAVAVATLVPAASGAAVTATSTQAWAPVAPKTIVAAPGDGTTSFVGPATSGSLRSYPKLSDIRVTYHGFPASARNSFEYATSLWERLVSSKVPIRVDATWDAMGGSALAQAGTYGAVYNYPGAPHTGVGYPMALADARAGFDLYPQYPDIVAEVNSGANWYLGTDGAGSASQYDLVTAALHELGHGLGFADSFDASGGIGSWGLSNGYPMAYDRLVADASGTPIISYGNDNATVYSKLTSGSVRFIGANAVAHSSGSVRLYSPAPYEPGSSIAHLDDTLYPRGTVNALMTPALAPGEVDWDPGDIVIGALRDIGWSTTTSLVKVPTQPGIDHVAAGDGKVWVHWTAPSDDGRSHITTYRVLAYKNGSSTSEPGVFVDTGATAREAAVSGLTNGATYRFKVMAHNAAGWSPGSATSPSAKPFDTSPFLNVDEFLLRAYADVLHRGPSPSTMAARRAALNTGSATEASTILELMGDASYAKAVPPAVRLYQAYFRRIPDTSGLSYWSTKLRTGTSLTKVSEQFSRSSEFTHTYGSLSNGAFVDLVYHNVLGRAPDSSGRTYWIRKLNSGYPRGSVMTSFSESSENVRKTQHRIDAVSIRFVLLVRVPTAGELATDEAALGGGTSRNTFIGQLLATGEYAARLS